MTRLSEICRYVRSKNAGPFWITVDMFFRDRSTFDAYSKSEDLGCAALAPLLRAKPEEMRRFEIPDLCVVKISYLRQQPQGGNIERDMHGGQQYVDLLAIDVGSAEAA